LFEESAMFSTRLVLVSAATVGGLLLPSPTPVVAQDRVEIQNSLGFDTAGPTEHFRAYWESLKDRHKMKGDVSDHLTAGEIDSVVMLEVRMAVALGPGEPGLQGELFSFMAQGNRFEAGNLPDQFDNDDRPLKLLVALFRTKKGDYGLITRYRKFTIVELKSMVGVAPVPAVKP
jgi:hypothetical protein